MKGKDCEQVGSGEDHGPLVLFVVRLSPEQLGHTSLKGNASFKKVTPTNLQRQFGLKPSRVEILRNWNRSPSPFFTTCTDLCDI